MDGSLNCLEINSLAKDFLRSTYCLDGPGRMEEAVEILHKWIQVQPQFRKKDFRPFYLETSLLEHKGSIEKTKETLDRLCTMRTLMPEYFGKINVSHDLGHLYDFVSLIVLPKLTKEYDRIVVAKVHNTEFSKKDYMNFFRLGVVICEYLKMHDYHYRIRCLLDLSEVNVMGLASKMDLVTTKQGISIFLEGYKVRLKSLHILSNSKLIDSVMSILKLAVNTKIANRFFVVKKITEYYDEVDRKLLPIDYGGEGISIQDSQAILMKALSSSEHLKHLEFMENATIDETCRQMDTFNDKYAGMAGTFRYLQVD